MSRMSRPLFQAVDFETFMHTGDHDLRRRILSQAAGGMSKQYDDAIRAVADEMLPAGWTMDDIAERFSIVQPATEGDQREVIRLDGHVVLELGPMRTETKLEGDSYVMTVTRDVKRYR
jgi:hypothetical protein